MRTKPLAVTSIARTAASDNGDLEITLAGERGNLKTIKLSPDAFAALTEMLTHHATRSPPPKRGPSMSRQPDKYAVGAGRHERVVLLRFENDLPYALAPDDARELGLMLLDEAKEVSKTPPVRVH